MAKRAWENYDPDEDLLEDFDQPTLKDATETAKSAFGIDFAAGAGAGASSDSKLPSLSIDSKQSVSKSQVKPAGSRSSVTGSSATPLTNSKDGSSVAKSAKKVEAGVPSRKKDSQKRSGSDLGSDGTGMSSSFMSDKPPGINFADSSSEEYEKSQAKTKLPRFATNQNEFIDRSMTASKSHIEKAGKKQAHFKASDEVDLDDFNLFDDDVSSFNAASGIKPPPPPMTKASEKLPEPTSKAPKPGGLTRRLSLPDRFKLPSGKEGCYQGKLQIPKRRWSRKWVTRLFAIQHNVLLVCSENPPNAMQICIPLSGITNITAEPGDDTLFTINYSYTTTKEKSKASELKVKAATVSDRDEWVEVISYHRRRALAAKSAFLDFVERDIAEEKLQAMHSIMKNAGLYSLVARAFNTLESKMKCDARYAFATWRGYALSKNLQETKVHQKEVETRTEQVLKQNSIQFAQEKVKAKATGNINAAVQILESIRQRKKHLALINLKLKTDRLANQEMQNDLTSGMVVAWQKSALMMAKSEVAWRDRLICRVSAILYNRVLRDAFLTLKALGVSVSADRRVRDTKLIRFLQKMKSNTKISMATVMNRWRDVARWENLRSLMLLKILKRKMNVETRSILDLWRLSALKQSAGDVVAINKLVSVLSIIDKKLLSRGFRNLYSFQAQSDAIETHQITANFNLMNSHLLKAMSSVPKHRAAVTFVHLMQRLVNKRIQTAFEDFRLEVQRRNFTERAAAVLHFFIRARQRTIKTAAFNRWKEETTRQAVDWNKKQKSFLVLEMAVKSVIQRKLLHAIRHWERVALMAKFSSDKEKLLLALDKVVRRGKMSSADLLLEKTTGLYSRAEKRCLALGWAAFEKNSSNTLLIRGLVRLHVLQRVISIADRIRIAKLASSFSALRCNASDVRQQQYEKHNREARERLHGSTKTLAGVQARQGITAEAVAAIQDALADREEGAQQVAAADSPTDYGDSDRAAEPSMVDDAVRKRLRRSSLKMKTDKKILKINKDLSPEFIRNRNAKKREIPRLPMDSGGSVFHSKRTVLTGMILNSDPHGQLQPEGLHRQGRHRRPSSSFLSSSLLPSSGRSSSDVIPSGVNSSCERALLEADAFIHDTVPVSWKVDLDSVEESQNWTLENGIVDGRQQQQSQRQRHHLAPPGHYNESRMLDSRDSSYKIVPYVHDSENQTSSNSVTVQPYGIGNSGFASDLSSDALLMELANTIDIGELLDILGQFSVHGSSSSQSKKDPTRRVDGSTGGPREPQAIPPGVRHLLQYLDDNNSGRVEGGDVRNRYVVGPSSDQPDWRQELEGLLPNSNMSSFVDNLSKEIDAMMNQFHESSGSSSSQSKHKQHEQFLSVSQRKQRSQKYPPRDKKSDNSGISAVWHRELIEELSKLASVSSSDSRWKFSIKLLENLLMENSHRPNKNRKSGVHDRPPKVVSCPAIDSQYESGSRRTDSEDSNSDDTYSHLQRKLIGLDGSTGASPDRLPTLKRRESSSDRQGDPVVYRASVQITKESPPASTPIPTSAPGRVRLRPALGSPVFKAPPPFDTAIIRTAPPVESSDSSQKKKVQALNPRSSKYRYTKSAKEGVSDGYLSPQSQHQVSSSPDPSSRKSSAQSSGGLPRGSIIADSVTQPGFIMPNNNNNYYSRSEVSEIKKSNVPVPNLQSLATEVLKTDVHVRDSPPQDVKRFSSPLDRAPRVLTIPEDRLFFSSSDSPAMNSADKIQILNSSRSSSRDVFLVNGATFSQESAYSTMVLAKDDKTIRVNYKINNNNNNLQTPTGQPPKMVAVNNYQPVNRQHLQVDNKTVARTTSPIMQRFGINKISTPSNLIVHQLMPSVVASLVGPSCPSEKMPKLEWPKMYPQNAPASFNIQPSQLAGNSTIGYTPSSSAIGPAKIIQHRLIASEMHTLPSFGN